MKKLAILSGAVLFSAASLALAATIHPMDKEQVMNTFVDKTITTIPLTTLNNKLQENAFTGFLGKDGKFTGQFASKPESDPQTDEGKWSVKPNGELCFSWQHWSNSKGKCLTVYNLNNSYAFVSTDGNILETVVLKDNVKSGNQMH